MKTQHTISGMLATKSVGTILARGGLLVKLKQPLDTSLKPFFKIKSFLKKLLFFPFFERNTDMLQESLGFFFT